MEKLTLLYGTWLWDEVEMRTPTMNFLGEFFKILDSGHFHVAFFNYRDFMKGAELKVAPLKVPERLEKLGIAHPGHLASKVKPKRRDNPSILRCPYMDKAHYKKLQHDLLHFGYRLITDSWQAYSYNWVRRACGLPTDRYMIASVNAGASFGSGGYGSIQPTIYMARDEEGPADINRFRDFFVFGWITGNQSRSMAQNFAKYRGKRLVGEVFFEKYVPCSVFHGEPIAWRVFYFDGMPFFKDRITADSRDYKKMPEPPQEVMEAFAEVMPSLFGAADLVLEEGGSWKCSRFMDGQFSQLPLGGNKEEFTEAFAKVVKESPHLPEWSWCLTAQVRDENRIGENHRVVHGTRHFAPGTKVWLHPVNWDERVGVIGIPRYSNKLTRVVMDVRKLEEFEIEKVRNNEILAALAYPYRSWPFSRFSPLSVGRGSWDNSDESRDRILQHIEWLRSLNPDGKRFS